MTDQLRERLARLDPMHPGVTIDPPSRDLLEGIMSTPVIEQPEIGPEQQKSNRWLIPVAAVAALVIAVGGVIALTGGGTDPVASGPPLELTAGGEDLDGDVHHVQRRGAGQGTARLRGDRDHSGG